jgi:tRNA 2-thiouridine synthesizing protein D
MIYSLLVLSSPVSGHGARHAAAFAHSAIARGHRIHRVFFLDEGAYTGAALSVFPQDESDRLQPWLDLADEHGVELALCISSALKRGMLDDTEADRHEKSGASIHQAFSITGLGQLVDATAHSERLVTFGG